MTEMISQDEKMKLEIFSGQVCELLRSKEFKKTNRTTEDDLKDIISKYGNVKYPFWILVVTGVNSFLPAMRNIANDEEVCVHANSALSRWRFSVNLSGAKHHIVEVHLIDPAQNLHPRSFIYSLVVFESGTMDLFCMQQRNTRFINEVIAPCTCHGNYGISYEI